MIKISEQSKRIEKQCGINPDEVWNQFHEVFGINEDAFRLVPPHIILMVALLQLKKKK
jgi:hypothetical protein